MQNIFGCCLIMVGIILTKGIMEHKPRVVPNVYNSRPTIGNQPSFEDTSTDSRRKIVKFSDGQTKIYIPAALLEPNSKYLAIIDGASQRYNVRPEVLLTHWYLESGMQFGGDRGGAGGYLALAQIVAKQTAIDERHRWQRFIANERDLRIVAEQCGYNLETLQGSSTGALGPMQFQPSTWVLGAVDGDGDGKACPLNLVDAMYTAARKISNDHRRCGSWKGAMSAYGGHSCFRDNSYQRRGQNLLSFFRNLWEKRTLLLSSN